MSTTLLAHLVLTAGYAGFQWTVHLAVYRMFPAVGAERFPAYVEAYQRRVTFLVGPLFVGMVLSTAALWLVDTGATPRWGRVAASLLLAIVLGVTGLLAVPLHGRLSGGWDAAAYGSLVRVDAVRVAAATANVGVAAALVTF